MIFNKGEVRKVGVEVINRLHQNFIIDTASYEITSVDGMSITTGDADIDGHMISTLFSASDVGEFYCIFTYTITLEIIKAKILIKVY